MLSVVHGLVLLVLPPGVALGGRLRLRLQIERWLFEKQ
jgi:hypothetical protein